MSETSANLAIAATVSQLLADIGEIPVLSPLKPLGSILVTIFEHAAVIEGNKEAVIMLTERVDSVVRVLINRTRDLDSAMPRNYLEGIRRLESVLLKIATALQKLRPRSGIRRLFAAKADASQLNNLASDLEWAIQMFGLVAAFESVQGLASKEVGAQQPLESQCPEINPTALRVYRELGSTSRYSMQVGRFGEQAVVVKKYYAKKERIFAQDLRQRLDQ
ncbi:hypothetical protein FRC01_007910, partial [Tulasnella sp. 417]